MKYLIFLIGLSLSAAAFPSSDHKTHVITDYKPQVINEQEEWLDAHNTARAAKNVPPLRWDDLVAKSAKGWAEHLGKECKMYHAKNPGYGENLAAAWGRKQPRSVYDVVGSWLNEENNVASLEYPWCKDGKMCGHWTQVMWRNSKSLGCHRVKCVIPSGKLKGKTQFISVCRYDPPGNFRGQKVY